MKKRIMITLSIVAIAYICGCAKKEVVVCEPGCIVEVTCVHKYEAYRCLRSRADSWTFSCPYGCAFAVSYR
jgi:hypothetical protein